MAERYTSLMALVLDEPVADVGAVVAAARAGGGVDRHGPVGDPREAQEVFWGGRMSRAVVRRVAGDDGSPLLRTEAYLGSEGLRQGMRRQARLLEALAAALDESSDVEVEAVRDLSGAADHDRAWLERIAAGQVGIEDAIRAHDEGRGTVWVHTHGAARFDIPDLELYGLVPRQVDAAAATLRHVHEQLLEGGLKAPLALPDATPVHLVPVRRAWQHLPLDWPGIGRAGQTRPDHDGPRATLSVLHRRRFGRYRLDLQGVVDRL